MATAKLRAWLGLDGKNFKAGIQGAKKETKSFQKTIKQIGPSLAAAFSAAAVYRFARSITKLGSDISDAALQAQMGTDSYQAFVERIIDAGSTADMARKALSRLRDAQENATSPEYAKGFEGLGMAIDSVASMSTENLVQAISNAYAETKNFGALVDLFGQRSAPRMEETLLEIAEVGLDGMTNAMLESGAIISADFIPQLDKAEDAINRFGRRALTVGANLLDQFTKFFIKTVEAAKAFRFKKDEFGQTFIDTDGMVQAWKDADKEIERQSKETITNIKDEYARSAKLRTDRLKQIMQEARSREEDRAKASAKAISDNEIKEAERAAKEKARLAEQAVKAQMQSFISEQEAVVSGLQDKLGMAQGQQQFSSLRNIGANIMGSGKNPWTKQESLLQQQLNVQKAQLNVMEQTKSAPGGVF